MANSRPLVLLAALTLAACRPPATATSPAVGDAAHRARAVLDRYGVEDIALHLPDSLVSARERASGVPVERALALAIEVFLAHRCFIARPGLRIELAGPTEATVIASDVAYLFALRVPELATTRLWVAIVAAPSGDLVAAPVRDWNALRRERVDREPRSRARTRSGTGVVTRGHHDRSAPPGRQRRSDHAARAP